MNAFATLLQDESVLRLGRTLLHFAWQGAAAAVVAVPLRRCYSVAHCMEQGKR